MWQEMHFSLAFTGQAFWGGRMTRNTERLVVLGVRGGIFMRIVARQTG